MRTIGEFSMKPMGSIRSDGPLVGLLILFSLIAAFSIVALCSPAVSSDASELERQTTTTGFMKLFDFEHYQQVFAKKYETWREAMRRQAYLWANILKVCTAAIAFRLRQQDHYLAVNRMSDWSPQEVEQTKNEALDEMLSELHRKSSFRTADGIGEPSHTMKDDKRTALKHADKLDEKTDIEDMAARSVVENLSGSRKVANPCQKPRELPISKLMRGGGSVDQSDRGMPSSTAESDAKVTGQKSDPLEPMSGDSQLKAVKLWWPELESLLSSSSKQSYISATDDKGPFQDECSSGSPKVEMFLDLRQSGCLSEPRDQDLCGACYIFAGITLAEWLYCKQTGQLLTFSEQYLIDCGSYRLKGMKGCSGGTTENVPQFITNFGLELLSDYPYTGFSAKMCPLDKEPPEELTGFVQMNLENYSLVPQAAFHEVLKFSPIFVAIATQDDFLQYAGGIYDGEGCYERPNHAMLLVGHGREDGQEFWLIRNSNGPQWGEQGYFKLAKSAPERCIGYQFGLVYGTKDGLNYQVEPIINRPEAD